MSNDTGKFPELFGSMVFNEDTMKERLSPSCYKQWKKSVSDGTPLDISMIYQQQMRSRRP